MFTNKLEMIKSDSGSDRSERIYSILVIFYYIRSPWILANKYGMNDTNVPYPTIYTTKFEQLFPDFNDELLQVINHNISNTIYHTGFLLVRNHLDSSGKKISGKEYVRYSKEG